ncbi:MAG: phosphoenolpyruvate--protein phosphotransferase [Desulfobacterales bacterium]|nr:phosphoenolpyruvate--protein phosphotransferase [Desulfobacterales bacterium]
MSTKGIKEIILKGFGASPGICIGRAYLLDKADIEVVSKYHISKEGVKNEKNRFKTAVKNAKDELSIIIKDFTKEFRQYASILESHILLLNDKTLHGKTIEFIEVEHINAEWALKKVVIDIKAKFQNMQDGYLKERYADIVHVADRIMINLVGVKDVNIKGIEKNVVLVSHDLSPAQTSQIDMEKIMGIVTDRGSMTSHTSIIAKSIGIPGVFGVENSTIMIKEGDLLILDGSTGLVIINPSEKTVVDYEDKKNKYEKQKAALIKYKDITSETTDKVHIMVLGNIELPEEAVTVLNCGGDGIGLYRTEFQYLGRNFFPSEQELFSHYKEVIEKMFPKYVTIRTLDINGDKAISRTTHPIEPNPALGLRAIRYCLKRTDVFMTQLRAILRAAVFGNVRILFPLICDYTEILEAKRFLYKAANSLDIEGIPYKRDIEIGIMIEVPSAVIMADIMAEQVDFFSIGTNDLIQYSLAIDRNNQQVAHLYNQFHPAIIRMIKHVADVGKEKGIKVFMCGEMAGDPMNTPILLGIGLDELSMNPQSIPNIKRMIRALNADEARIFVAELLKKKTSAEVKDAVLDSYGKIIKKYI